MDLVQVDLSVVIILLLVWSLYFILKRSFFDPINRILEERDLAINGAQKESLQKGKELEEKSRIYQEKLNTARLEVYNQQDVLRTEGLNERTQIIHKAREESEDIIQSTKKELQGQVVNVKKDLESELTPIADGIVKAILR